MIYLRERMAFSTALLVSQGILPSLAFSTAWSHVRWTACICVAIRRKRFAILDIWGAHNHPEMSLHFNHFGICMLKDHHPRTNYQADRITSYFLVSLVSRDVLLYQLCATTRRMKANLILCFRFCYCSNLQISFWNLNMTPELFEILLVATADSQTLWMCLEGVVPAEPLKERVKMAQTAIYPARIQNKNLTCTALHCMWRYAQGSERPYIWRLFYS